jgi:hypothetical protein
MRTLMAVLADRAEEVDGKGSVIGIFQAVTAKRFPTTLNGVLVLRFSLDDPEDDADQSIILDSRLMGPDGEQLAAMQVVDFAPPRTVLQPLRGIDVTIDLRGTLLPVPGVYRFEVWAKDELRAVVPLSAWLSD